MNDAAASPAPKTYRIRAESLSKLDSLVADLAKKAVKLGCAPVGYRVLSEESERRAIREDARGGSYRILAANESAHHDEIVKVIPFVVVESYGEAPRINGWRLAARLEHHGEGNIINHNPLVPEPLPMRFRTCPPDCEHCNLKRNRADTYALVSDEGVHKQVGSDCLKDFLGHASPDALIRSANWIGELHEALAEASEWGGGGGGRSYEDLERVLAVTCACIRLDGWVSRAREEASYHAVQATAGAVGSVLWTRRSDVSDSLREWLRAHEPEAADGEKAVLVREWAKALPADGSEYESNLRVLAHSGIVEKLGLACSMASAYDRALGQLKEAGRPKSKKDSVHVGVVGERKAWKLECERVTPIQSEQWGMSYLCVFRDVDGNVLKSFISGSSFHNQGIEAEKHYRGKATVKEHADYKGIKETVLSRCKLEVCAVDAPAEDPKPAKSKGKKGASVDAA